MCLHAKKHWFIITTKMNKKILLIPIIALPLFLSSCSEKKVTLTFGTYINQEVSSLKELSTSELYDHLYNNNETILLAVYQGEYSNDCLCWSTFQNIIVTYMNKYHEQVYVYNAQNEDESINSLHIEKAKDSRPDLYIFEGNKRVERFIYPKMQDNKIFTDTTAEYMYEKVHKFTNKPSMYFVDDNYLDNRITKTKDSFAVAYIREGCADCNYVIPHVLIPYTKEHSLKGDILLFDLQSYYDLSKDDSASEEEKAQYQNIKNYYGLSVESNAKYGYLNGVVPTVHYYENGIIKDATIFFNDVIEQKEDGSFFISDSFYSDDRLVNLSYLYNFTSQKVLKGMEIKEGVMQTKSGAYYWAQEFASKYHTPLLKAFLDYYCI